MDWELVRLLLALCVGADDEAGALEVSVAAEDGAAGEEGWVEDGAAEEGWAAEDC